MNTYSINTQSKKNSFDWNIQEKCAKVYFVKIKLIYFFVLFICLFAIYRKFSWNRWKNSEDHQTKSFSFLLRHFLIHNQTSKSSEMKLFLPLYQCCRSPIHDTSFLNPTTFFSHSKELQLQFYCYHVIKIPSYHWTRSLLYLLTMHNFNSN